MASRTRTSTFFTALLVLVVGCTSSKTDPLPQTNRSAADPGLGERGEIKIAVFEYLIKLTTAPNSGPVQHQIFFADLTDKERGELLMRVKDCDLRAPNRAHLLNGRFVDTKTQEQGSVIEIKTLDIVGEQAHVRAGYFLAAGTIFEFGLTNDPTWRITKTNRQPLIVE